MKVKVKGLVFVGFAAAIFAANAMADDAADKKTVTSRYFTEQTYQKISNKVQSTDANPDWTSNTQYPTMATVNAKVTELSNAVSTIQGDNEYTKVTTSTSGGVTTKTVELQQTAATQNSELTGTLDTTTSKKLVTAGAVSSLIDTSLSDSTNTDTTFPTSAAVVSYAEKLDNKATSITTGTGGNFDSTDAYPTTSAVYDFVTTQAQSDAAAYQVKVSQGSTGLYVGARNAGDTDSVWKQITTSTVATETSAGSGVYTNAGASTNYVTMSESAGVYTINLSADQIANSIANDGSTKLATENAVYDYVQAQTNGHVLPAIDAQNNSACLASGAHCALVTTGTGSAVTMEWTVMAGGEASGS